MPRCSGDKEALFTYHQRVKQLAVAPEGFEKDLLTELQKLGAKVLWQSGRLVEFENARRRPVFAHQIWLTPEHHSFSSVKNAADILKSKNRLWALHSTENHRRAELIQQQLPVIKSRPVEWQKLIQYPKLGAWTLISPNELILSSDTDSDFHNGEPQFAEDSENAPSRAYLKLWEWMTKTGNFPKRGQKAVDLGSCPGGWTWVLDSLGCEIWSVDKAPLDERLRHKANIHSLKKDAFTLKPEELPELDWLFSDLICYPQKLLELVQIWMASGRVKNFVCTIKFQGETDFAILEDRKSVV